MSTNPKNMSDPTQQCLQLLHNAMDKAARSEFSLHLPKPESLRQSMSKGHFHSNPEFFFQISGKITFTFPESKLTLNAGEVLLIPSWLSHAERSTCYKTTSTVVLMINISELAWHLAKTISPEKYVTSDYCFVTSPKLGLLMSMCDELTHIRHDSVRYDKVAFNSMTMAILKLIENIITATGKPQQGENHKISSCRHLINSNMANPELNVQYLAHKLGCNADYLSHLFLTKVGVSLTEFINSRRVQVAVSLLNSENMNISEVAYACGYSDPGYFSRVFRKIIGKSPGEFRKQPAERIF